MNTTSNSRAFFAKVVGGLAAMLLLGSCIQGPWDYYPKDPPVFKGIWLNAYAITGRPLNQVCMEKFLRLDEERTDAFAFFDSAEVTVTGRFSGTTRTVALSQDAAQPNCFLGDSAALVEKGQDYDLVARVVWDSAGTRITDTLRARAQVPDSFSVRRTAVAPSFAFTGGLPPNIYTPEFILSLPPEVRADKVLQGYLGQFNALDPKDTVAVRAWITKNGPAIQGRLKTLLSKYQSTYKEGDTLFYLNGILNTMSHYYTSDYSKDVAGVLITHRFDSTAERPETAFQGFFGVEPESTEFYFPGSLRRLGMYTAVRTPKGYNLLDSIGLVNTWFHTKLNRLYFYAMEQAYVDYVQTAIEGGQDPRIKPQYNVTGGSGFFVGGVVDSFDANIKVDSFTQSYSLPAVRAFECRQEGWYHNKDCASYYREYCGSMGWITPDCGGDAVRANLEGLLANDSFLVQVTSRVADSLRASKLPADTASLGSGITHYCVENAFPDLNGTCAAAENDCDRPGKNNCKQALWDYCKDNQWKPAQCGSGLAWYCRDNDRPSEVMCRHADDWCKANSQAAACK